MTDARTSAEISPQQRWTAVDGYIAEHLLPADAALDSRPGTLIITDNVVRDGAILDPKAYDPELGDKGVQGVRRFYEMATAQVEEGSVSATAIQTVGAKGYDGFALVLVEGAG